MCVLSIVVCSAVDHPSRWSPLNNLCTFDSSPKTPRHKVCGHFREYGSKVLETCSSSRRRVPADALSRVREDVYLQYENMSIPTLHTTLTYLTAEGAAAFPAGKYKWSKTTCFRCM